MKQIIITTSILAALVTARSCSGGSKPCPCPAYDKPEAVKEVTSKSPEEQNQDE